MTYQVRPLLQQGLDHRRLVGLGRQVDGLLAVVVGGVQAGAQVDEQRANGLLSGGGCQM